MQSKPSCNDLADNLGRALLRKNLTISTAESCTGGLIGAAITSVPGASAWFRGGIIAYDNAVKISHLDVAAQTIERYGAVSGETVHAMANGAARKFGTDCAIAVSGIAGPEGGSAEKPVGLAYIGVYCNGKTHVVKRVFSGDRESVRAQAAETGMRILLKML
jgi:PncC family amidohydrolase